MSNDTFFDTIRERRDDDVREIDVGYSIQIRNHLVQLFRKAVAVDPKIERINVGMGAASVSGTFLGRYTDDSTVAEISCNDYGFIGGLDVLNRDTLNLLRAVEEYSDNFPNLPYISDITLDDVEPTSSKRAKIWKR